MTGVCQYVHTAEVNDQIRHHRFVQDATDINHMNMTQYRISLDLHDVKVGRGSNLLLFVTFNNI